MAARRLNRRQLIAQGATGLAWAGTVIVPEPMRVLAQDAVAKRGGVPRIALSQYPHTLAPGRRNGWEAGWVSSLIYDSPLGTTADGDIVAGMSVGLSEDEQGATVSLTPRNGVFFANGEVMTAADIAWSIEQAATRSTEDDAWRWSRVESVLATDDGRVLLRLRARDTTLAATLASTLVPVIPAGVSMNDGDLASLPPGTGPFLPVDGDGSMLRFRGNEWHWVIGQPRFNGLHVIAIEQEIERTTSLVTGLVDVAPNVPSLDIPLLRNDERIMLHGGISRQICALVVRMDREPLTDVRVRRLVVEAIDRESLVESATAGTGRPADWLFPPEHWAGPLEPEAAGRLPTDVIRDEFAGLGLFPGWPLRLICPEWDPSLANTAILLQEQLAEAGIAIALDLLDPVSMQEAIDNGDFNLSMAYLPPWIDPHEVVYPWLHTEGSQNVSAYASVRMDRTLALARGLADLDQRGALYRDAQRLVSSEVPLAPLFATPWFDGVTTRIQNYRAGLPGAATGLASGWFEQS